MIPIIIGSRGSPLALAQSRLVMGELKKAWASRNFEIHIIKTEGDKRSEQGKPAGPAAGEGLFVAELEKALLAGEIHLAVHSLKDMPTTSTEGLMIAAVPKRADARDVIITRGADLDEELPPGAVVATGSPRRVEQLLQVRHDLVTEEIHGNVDTRLKRFRENKNWSGLILAAAGLARLKPDLAGLTVTPLPFEQMLPAPGQGALAVQSRMEHSADERQLVRVLHDPVTEAAVKAERMFLHALGGGCQEPIGAYAEVSSDDMLVLEGIAWLFGEGSPRRGHLTRRMDQAEKLGVDLAVELSR